jgi:hypothetical protein
LIKAHFFIHLHHIILISKTFDLLEIWLRTKNKKDDDDDKEAAANQAMLAKGSFSSTSQTSKLRREQRRRATVQNKTQDPRWYISSKFIKLGNSKFKWQKKSSFPCGKQFSYLAVIKPKA